MTMDIVILILYGALLFGLVFALFGVGIVGLAVVLERRYPDESAREESLLMRYGASITAVLAGPLALVILYYVDVGAWLLRAIVGG